MAARDAKQFVYRYGDETTEFVEDLDGAVPTPQKDQIILRHGHLWKVISVTTHISPGVKGNIPVVLVHLVGTTASPSVKPVA